MVFLLFDLVCSGSYLLAKLREASSGLGIHGLGLRALRADLGFRGLGLRASGFTFGFTCGLGFTWGLGPLGLRVRIWVYLRARVCLGFGAFRASGSDLGLDQVGGACASGSGDPKPQPLPASLNNR